MNVAVPKETYPGERRVSLVPANVSQLIRGGWEVVVEAGAGDAAGFNDKQYSHQGPRIVYDRDELFAANVVTFVRALGANPRAGKDDQQRLRSGQTLVGMCDPLGHPQAVQEVAETGATLFALELIPRITRAQSMDVLSSMATIAGYRAVLLAAVELPKMFPMLMTAAGHAVTGRACVRHRGRRGRFAGHRHRPAAGRGRAGLRRAARRAGSRSRAWAANSSSWSWTPGRRRTRAATPRPWTRSSTANSAS